MKSAIVAALLILAVAGTAYTGTPERSETSAAVLHLTALAPRHPARREPLHTQIVAAIERASWRHGVDPLLLTTWAFYESSLRPAVRGARGEIGLLQTHGEAAEGCDLESIEGEADCGAAWLAGRIAHCGSLVGGLTAYASGSCTPRTETTRALVAHRLAAWARLRAAVGEE